VSVARHFLPIIEDEAHALQTFFECIEGIHGASLCCQHNCQLITYLQLLSHQIPHQKILVVDDGKESLAPFVFTVLQKIENCTGGLTFFECTYTTQIQKALEKARNRFAEMQDRFDFRPLNISDDVVAQGLDENSYDTVLMSNGFLATQELTTNLANVQRVLKPGGHLILQEGLSSGCLAMSLECGVLPNIWNTSDDLSIATTLDPSWDETLKYHGFQRRIWYSRHGTTRGLISCRSSSPLPGVEHECRHHVREF
jgi:hypothetical protein